MTKKEIALRCKKLYKEELEKLHYKEKQECLKEITLKKKNKRKITNLEKELKEIKIMAILNVAQRFYDYSEFTK